MEILETERMMVLLRGRGYIIRCMHQKMHLIMY